MSVEQMVNQIMGSKDLSREIKKLDIFYFCNNTITTTVVVLVGQIYFYFRVLTDTTILLSSMHHVEAS